MFYKPINVLYMKKLILTLLGILFLGAFSAFAQEFTLLTDGSKLADGMQFYIANVANKKAMSTTQNKNNRGSVAVTIANNVLTPVENAQLITLEDAGSGNWYLKVDNGYLYAASSSANHLKTSTSSNNNCKASITINSNGNATIKFTGSYTRNLLQYVTSNNGLFSCYSGNQLDVAIFAATEVGPVTPTITLAFAETEGSVNIGETLTLPAVNATVSDDSTPELTYTYTSDKPEVATVENGVVTGVAAGTVTITASCIVEGYNVKDAKYAVTVIDPNALEVTYDFLNENYGLERNPSTYETEGTLTNGPVSISLAKTSGNGFRLWSDGLRVYKGKVSLTFNITSDYIINEIVFAGNNVVIGTLAYNDTKLTDATWSGAATSVTITAAPTENKPITTIKVKYSKAGDPSKTTPKLSFAETEVGVEFGEGKTLAVQVPTSDTEGLSYTYTSSDPAVATVDGETITLVGTGSTTITVTSAETETLNSATASYTLVSKMVYHSIADLLKYAKNGETVNIAFPMTVGHVGPQGKNFYVTDGEGYMLIYNQNAIIMPDYENLDVIPAGWTATCTIYNGLPELVPTTAPAEATEKGTYAIETIDATNWAAQPLNKIVIVDNVVFAAATPGENASTADRNFTGKVGDTEIKFFNNFKLASVPADTYKVTAVVSYFKGGQTTIATEANQLAPISFSAQPTEAVITPTPENDEIKVKAGDIITFTFANASKLEVVIETEEAPESESAPVLKAAAEPITVEGDTYKYTVPAQVLNTIITVTPYNAEGEKLADRAASVMLVNADTTGVIDVTVAGEGEVEYFNLQGVRIANPESGLYIRRQGKQVSKVYLR